MSNPIHSFDQAFQKSFWKFPLFKLLRGIDKEQRVIQVFKQDGKTPAEGKMTVALNSISGFGKALAQIGKSAIGKLENEVENLTQDLKSAKERADRATEQWQEQRQAYLELEGRFEIQKKELTEIRETLQEAQTQLIQRRERGGNDSKEEYEYEQKMGDGIEDRDNPLVFSMNETDREEKTGSNYTRLIMLMLALGVACFVGRHRLLGLIKR